MRALCHALCPALSRHRVRFSRYGGTVTKTRALSLDNLEMHCKQLAPMQALYTERKQTKSLLWICFLLRKVKPQPHIPSRLFCVIVLRPLLRLFQTLRYPFQPATLLPRKKLDLEVLR